MPKVSPLQTNFSGGELGPLSEGRVELEKYDTGLEECLNFIPTIEGPIDRRPGSRFVTTVKDPSKPPRFIPFKLSNALQYIVEAGENYFRFYTQGGQVVTNGTSFPIGGVVHLGNPFLYTTNTQPSNGVLPFWGVRSDPFLVKDNEGKQMFGGTNFVTGSILEFATPYDFNMVQNISWAQKGDTLWIFHSSIPTYTLQRFGPQDWDLKPFRPNDGPYLPLNSRRVTGDLINGQLMVLPVTANITSGTKGGTTRGLTATILAHSTCVIANAIDDGQGRVKVFVKTNHNFQDGQSVYVAGVQMSGGPASWNNTTGPTPGDGTSSESSVWKINVVNASSFILLSSQFSDTYLGSGRVTASIFKQTDLGRNFAFYSFGQRYSGYLITGSNLFSLDPAITPTWNPSLMKFSFDLDSVDATAFTGTTISTVFQFGVYDRVNGYPSVGTLHQDRLVMAGAPGRATEFAASKVSNYQTFSTNEASSLIVTDQNALQFNLLSESSDPLRWVLSGQQGLYFLSTSTEFLVSPSRLGEALTPTNINNDVIGEYGSGNVKPVKFGEAVIYAQNSERKIRELRFFANLQSFKSNNITSLSDHIGYPDIDGLEVQKETIPLVWAYKSDGNLISMCYARDDSQAVAGWVRHQLGGQSDSGGTAPKVKAFAAMRDSTGRYDQLWMAVQRYINGTSTVTVEYLNEPYRHRDTSQKVRDAYFVDCGATYDSSIVIAGIALGSALVTASNHGLSNNDLVLLSDVVGLNSSVVSANNFTTTTNLVNEKVFIVGSAATNTFFLQDFNSSIIQTLSYSPYFSGGKIRKLVSNVSGLTWLKNETVDIWADGGYQGQAVVNSAGLLTLNAKAAVVSLGYAYKSQAKTLVKDKGSATGSAMGMQRRTYRVAFRLRDTYDFAYGSSYDNLIRADFERADQDLVDQASPLFTGIHRDGIDSDYGFTGQVVFEQSSPGPGMVQSITFMMDENDL